MGFSLSNKRIFSESQSIEVGCSSSSSLSPSPISAGCWPDGDVTRCHRPSAHSWHTFTVSRNVTYVLCHSQCPHSKHYNTRVSTGCLAQVIPSASPALCLPWALGCFRQLRMLLSIGEILCFYVATSLQQYGRGEVKWRHWIYFHGHIEIPSSKIEETGFSLFLSTQFHIM